jgi:hypothetical protein
MDERYREIYGAIYASRTTPEAEPFDRPYPPYWPGPPPWEEIGDAVETAEREGAGQRRLREDGKALLALNFQDLVMLPLRLGGRISDGQLLQDVRDDMRMLVADAVEAGDRTDDISAHELVDSLSRNWSRLRIGRYRLWERSQ